MKIFLIGLPGSGKTTLGKKLAELFKIQFIDLDTEIEKTSGKRIREIFKELGEDHFRELESSQLSNIIKLSGDFVMATGGGTPCFFSNMDKINYAGSSVFLDVPVMEIVRRINKTDRAERPLLGRLHHEELHDQIKHLRTQRLPVYIKSKVVLTGAKISAKEIVDAISG